MNCSVCYTQPSPLQNAPGTEAIKLTLKVILGRQCSGSVGRAVTSNTRGPRFQSSHRKFLEEHLFTLNSIEKTKIMPGISYLRK